MLFILPHSVSAQTKDDYEHVMNKFIKFYNAQRYDSVYNLYADKDITTPDKNEKLLRSFMKKYGRVLSYEYLGVDASEKELVTVFVTHWSKAGDKTTSFSLDKNNKFRTWRFITSSEGIDKLLKKAGQ
jgi:hypothetical protein